MGLRVPSVAGWHLDDLAPLMNMMDVLNKAKLKRQRIQFRLLCMIPRLARADPE